MSQHMQTALLGCLIVLLVPGALEVTENLWHLGFNGHVAHAVDAGADHQPEGSEHGCSGTFHLCSCCQSLSFRVPKIGSLPAVATPLWRARHGVPLLYDPPLLPRVEHPPRA